MRGYTGSQEAAKWSLSGARPVLEVLGWSPVTWIITDCMHTVHYHAITWCYLCSVNQYASFGTP